MRVRDARSRRSVGIGVIASLLFAWTGVVTPDGSVEERNVLRSPLAGSWYDADPVRLDKEISGYLAQVETPPRRSVCALVLPHAGYRWSGRVAAHGVRQLAGQKITRVVVLGPSHRVAMENVVSVPASTHYATPLGEVPIDRSFVERFLRHRAVRSIPAAHDAEHSVQIQVPLLQKALGRFRLVPVVVGDLDATTAGKLARILRGLLDESTLVVASSDFTHYGPNYRFVPFRDDVQKSIKELDMGAWECIRDRDAPRFRSYLDRTGATVCGRRPIEILLRMLPSNARGALLEYDSSGRMVGDFTNSVSYLAIAFQGKWASVEPLEPDAGQEPLGLEDRARLLRLAREAIRVAVMKQRFVSPEEANVELTAHLREASGAFVSLYRGGRLRGCCGAIYPTHPLYRTVIQQAVNAALFDSRFSPVREDEISLLRLEISVLTEPRSVASCREIRIGEHGIVLEKDGRRAVYLPQVAPEQGWDLEETLSHLSRKARLPAEAWKDGASFLVFEAMVFGETKDPR